MPSNEYSTEERALLLDIAVRSIEHGIEMQAPLPVSLSEFSPHVNERRACFVTLRKEGDLRGCTGTIVPRFPLIRCVAEHAYTSAFLDGRFPPLESDELESLTVGISVLTTPIPINFADERDLLSKLRPGVDGLVLEVGRSLGTLLPSVWEALPESEAFLRQLKRKAGLDPDFWSNEIRVSRYTAEEFGPSP